MTLSLRPKSRAHAARAFSLAMLGLVLTLVGILPNRTGTAASKPSPAEAAAAAAAASAPAAHLDSLVLIDTSQAMAGAPIATAQRSAAAYIRSLPASARVGIVTYGQFPTYVYRLSTNHVAAIASLSTLVAEGDSTIFDGISFASEQFETFTTDEPAKRQVLLIGSGTADKNSATLDTAVGVLRQHSIRADAIGVDAGAKGLAIDSITGSTGGSKVLWSDKDGITKLAATTAAWATPPAPYVAPVYVPKKTIFGSKLVLGIGVLFMFAGLTFLLLNVTGPRAPKVNLTGITEVDRKKAKNATAVSGIAERLTEVADKALEKKGRSRGLNSSLERAGLNMRAGEFIIVAFCTVLGIAAFLSWWKSPLIGGIAGVVLLVFGPRKWLARKGVKRSNAFGEQLSDTLQLLSSSLRAGQGLMQAIDSVAKEGDAPASDEFRRVTTETRLGRDLIDSLRAMADRIQSEDFNWVIPAIEINREVGGDLAEVLDTVASTIRDRADIRRQVKTLSAEGRLSAYVLLSLPCVIAGFIQMSNPSYLAELTKSPGYFLAGAAVLMMVIGGTWLFKLCKIEF